jgi:hypothetical protein
MDLAMGGAGLLERAGNGGAELVIAPSLRVGTRRETRERCVGEDELDRLQSDYGDAIGPMYDFAATMLS